MLNKDTDVPVVRTAYVNDAASRYDEKRFRSDSGRLIDAVEKRIFMSALNKLKTGSYVLEVGCGTGRFLLSACEKGMHCEALDASPDMIEQAKKKILEKYPDTSFHIAQAAQIPAQDDSFDFVYSIRLLNQTESVDYALSVIREMYRIAKPGGLILVEFVNYYRPRFGREGSAVNDVYLKPMNVFSVIDSLGGKLVSTSGAFFFGMTAQHRTPRVLRPVLRLLESVFSRFAPRLCARCYILFSKPSG